MLALLLNNAIDGRKEGILALLKAVNEEDEKTIDMLLNANVLIVDEAFHIVAKKGHHKILTKFISTLQKKDRMYITLPETLIIAAEAGHKDIISVLIEKNLLKENPKLDFAVIVAAQYGRLEVLEMLLREGAAPNEDDGVRYKGMQDLFAECGGPNTNARGVALCAAAQEGHANVVAALVRAGASSVKKALIDAVQRGHTETIKVLVRECWTGVNGGIKDEDMWEAMKTAAEFGEAECVVCLVDAGRERTTTHEIWPTPDTLAATMLVATWHGHANVVRTLLAMGAYGREKVLVQACGLQYEGVVKAVMEAGVDMEACRKMAMEVLRQGVALQPCALWNIDALIGGAVWGEGVLKWDD